MKTDEAIEMLRAMQNKVVDYAEMVGAPDFAYGCKYVYPEPEDYAIEEAIKALEEIQQYREVGTVEECREAVEKLKKAEEALNVILSGNYNDECNFCVHNDNPMANCQCICGDGSWCIHNAKWNGKTSEDDNLEGMEDVVSED